MGRKKKPNAKQLPLFNSMTNEELEAWIERADSALQVKLSEYLRAWERALIKALDERNALILTREEREYGAQEKAEPKAG